MRRQAVLLGALAALGMAGSLPGAGGIPSGVVTVTNTVGSGGASALTASFAGMSRRSMRFAGGSGDYGFGRPRYIKRPFRTVAQDKRDARKKRNQLRNKR